MTEPTAQDPGQRRQHSRVQLSADRARRGRLLVISPTTDALFPLSDVQAIDLSLGGAGLESGPGETTDPADAEGLQFTSTEYLPEGAEIQLKLPGDDGDDPVTIKGRLVRVRGMMARDEVGELTLRYRYGVRFEPASAAGAARALET